MGTDVDVAVVGGGPAGAAVAHYVAGHGLTVLVCERKTFPRDKTCGDGLTPRAVQALREMGLGERMAGWQRIAGVRLHADGRVGEWPFPPGEAWPDHGLVVRRRDLDQAVLDHAAAAGAKVLYGADVRGPILDDGGTVTGISVRRDGHTEDVRARWVVCAEGAASRFVRALGRRRDPGYPLGIAMRQYVGGRHDGAGHHEAGPAGWFDVFLDVRARGRLVPGYAWSFPVPDGAANIGVGLIAAHAEMDLPELQRQLCARLYPDAPGEASTPPRGGRLFMGGSVWPPYGPGYVLVGDAAGMVNPFSGEGIAYAYETGRIAGRHLVAAARGGAGVTLGGYGAELARRYGGYYRLGRGFAWLLTRPAAMQRMVAETLRSPTNLSTALSLLTNLEPRRPRGAKELGSVLVRRAANLWPGA